MWHSYFSAGIDNNNSIIAKVSADKNSPWFSGHFPNDPILPAIAQLNIVTETIAKVLDKDLSLKTLTRIKFKKIIRPGNILDIHAVPGKKENHYHFRITSKQQEVCSGRLVLAPKKEH
ncbi:MAG: hypothetical protein U9R57_00830 [Thermodesulfobacteriota bacterium]|nr:hypothetical protein [Thermodesulfobacteriota bacterium]